MSLNLSQFEKAGIYRGASLCCSPEEKSTKGRNISLPDGRTVCLLPDRIIDDPRARKETKDHLIQLPNLWRKKLRLRGREMPCPQSHSELAAASQD